MNSDILRALGPTDPDLPFVLVRDTAGEPVTAAAATAPGMALDLRFHDGEVPAVVGHGAAPRGKKKKPDGGGGQGSLL